MFITATLAESTGNAIITGSPDCKAPAPAARGSNLALLALIIANTVQMVTSKMDLLDHEVWLRECHAQ